jgi:hypothetical protein
MSQDSLLLYTYIHFRLKVEQHSVKEQTLDFQTATMNASITTQTVIDHYSTLAREDSIQNAAHMQKAAAAFGYSPEDLASVPEGANLGLSCGNPLAIAGLKEVSSVEELKDNLTNIFLVQGRDGR